MKFYNIKNTAKVALFVALPLLAAGVTSCQNKEYESFPVAVQPISQADIKTVLQGDRYVIAWSELPAGQKMQVTRYIGNTVNDVREVEGTEYIHDAVETNIPFTYVLKVMDKDGNVSSGVVHSYTRPGASTITGINMSQVDKVNGYDAKIEWNACSDADKIELSAMNSDGIFKETLDGKATSYILPDVKVGDEWLVTLVAVNDKGPSLASHANLKIGKTQIGFLGIYETEDDLVQNGDDDEACAWLWTKAEYPTAQYVSFSSIKSAADVEPYRVLFWLRDIETGNFDDVFTYPDNVKSATPIISEWYKNGGSLLLWSHACPYIEQIGRLPIGTYTAEGADPTVGTGKGWNGAGDDWVLAVSAYPGEQFPINYFEHPIYRGFDNDFELRDNNTWTAIHMLGPGWREDHNCLFHNLPGKLTGKGNQDRACYDQSVAKFGIIPLGTWDGQRFWIGQLNVWEAQQGDTEYKGTVICIGNGGCEFSQNNPDGSKDVQAYPKNNIYQDNILRLAKNSLEYLKTR